MDRTGRWAGLARTFLVVRPNQGQAVRAANLTLSVAVGLVLSSLVFGPTTGVLGLTGALAAGVARDAPIRRRVATMVVVGAITMAHVVLGMAIGGHEWLLPPVITLLTVAGVWGWHALRTGIPGPINMLFAIVYGQHMGAMGYSVGHVLPPFALCWAGAAVTSLVVFAFDVNAPLREAVDDADEAVSRYRDRPDDMDASDVDELRAQAHLAIEDAWTALADSTVMGIAPGSKVDELREHLTGVQLNFIELLHSERFPASPLDVADHLDQVPQGDPHAGYLLRTALEPGSRPWLVALRAGLAVLLASSMIILAPIGRPYWAVLTALIVLHNGASRTDLTVRAIHRVVGTGIGVFVYFGVVHAHAGPWLRLAIVIVALYCMNVWVARNYALGVVFITTYALLILPIAGGVGIVTLMRERLGETMIGALASLLAIWFIGRRAPVLLVRGQYRRTLTAIEQVLLDQARGDTLSADARENRRHLVFELRRADEVLAAERPDNPNLSRWLRVQTAVSRFGFDVLATGWRRIEGSDRAADVAQNSLHRLIGSLPPISPRDIDQAGLATTVDGIHRDYMEHVGRGHRPSGDRVG